MKRKFEGFVLSTGRTGTVAITDVLNTCQDVTALHEPNPSRRFHLLGSLFLEGKIREETLANLYFKSRKKIIHNIKTERYIEVNPFIWGLGSIFCKFLDSPKILHLTRDARTYIPSILNFKAKGWHRYVIDFMPFWHIKVSKFIGDIDRWDSLTEEEKTAWRWVLINKTIAENEQHTANYLRVKFEDICTQNKAVQEKTLNNISDFFNIQLDLKTSCNLLEEKINPSSKGTVSVFESFDKKLQKSILNIATPLLKEYRYY